MRMKARSLRSLMAVLLTATAHLAAPAPAAAEEESPTEEQEGTSAKDGSQATSGEDTSREAPPDQEEEPAVGEFDADSYPLEVIARPQVLPVRMLALSGDTVRINLSKGDVGDPISLAPDILFGLTPRLTVGVTHWVGICMTGTSGGCPSAYDDLAIEGRFALLRTGLLRVAARAGLAIPRIKGEFTLGAIIGVMVRLKIRRLAIELQPTIYAGGINRNYDMPRTDYRVGTPPGPEETIQFPIRLIYQLHKQTAVFAASGVYGPFSDFGDLAAIPVGLGTLFAVNGRLDLGAEFRFTNLFGGDSSDIDLRELVLRVTVRI